MAAPWNLVFGDAIYAKVSGINFYGEGQHSNQGNGATVLMVPDAPMNVQDNVAVTTSQVIGITWDDGFSTGGSPILDYRITYD